MAAMAASRMECTSASVPRRPRRHAFLKTSPSERCEHRRRHGIPSTWERYGGSLPIDSPYEKQRGREKGWLAVKKSYIWDNIQFTINIH